MKEQKEGLWTWASFSAESKGTRDSKEETRDRRTKEECWWKKKQGETEYGEWHIFMWYFNVWIE